jgi:hypothetical protein
MENILRADGSFTVRIFDRHGIAIRYVASHRDATYPNVEFKNQTVGTVSLMYVLLGNTGFGAVEWRWSLPGRNFDAMVRSPSAGRQLLPVCGKCCNGLLSDPVRNKPFRAIWHKHENCFWRIVRSEATLQRSLLMTPSEVHASPAAQWLQGLLAKGAPSQTGTQSSNGATELPRDSTSISARAFQLNQAAGTSLKSNSQPAQSSGVSAAQHHHRHHSTHNQTDTSAVNSAARAGVSNLQKEKETGSSASVSSTDSHAVASSELASKAANDVRVAYSHITAPDATPSPNRGFRSISVIA